MIVSRQSPYTGLINEMDLDVTPEQLAELCSPGRRLIQQIFPNLTSAEREFVKTGYTQEDWDQIFGGLDDEQQDAADGLRDVVYGDNKE
jgi:hypothetical protein